VVKTGSGSRYFLSDTAPPSINREAMKDLLSALPGGTITLTKELKQKDAKKAEESLKTAQPRATFSLFGLGGPKEETPAAAPAPSKKAGFTKKPVKNAPRGVPSINKWRKNRDGSITGQISGSSSFTEGEKITTSPIASGTIDGGEIVRTGSGSRYFLA